MDDEHRRELSIPATAISGNSTRTSIPATVPTPSGEDSFAAGILTRLGIPIHMADRNDRGLHVAYEKYKAYLEACCAYERELDRG